MSEARRRLLADAVVSGLIGYGCVVLFHAVISVAQGQSPFHTASFLGAALFWGAQAPVAVEPAYVLAMNGAHLAAFLLFGLFAAWLVYETELHPRFWYLAFVLFVTAALASYAAVLALTVLRGSILDPWLVVGSSVLGAVGMAGYLAAAHRSLLRSIAARPDPDVGLAG